MENLDQVAWLNATYIPMAVYFSESDCVEYVNEDTVCIYDRIDEFLTLIYDETCLRVIGFKLKGFRYIFENHLKAHMRLNQSDFVLLVQAIEAVCQTLGEEFLGDAKRQKAYIAARKIADKVELWDLPLAA